MIGKCLWFDVKRGYGFLRTPDGKDVFVHYSKILAAPGEFRLLSEGDTVEFELFHAERGSGETKPQARNVRVVKGDEEHEDLRKKSIHLVQGRDDDA